MLLTNYYVPDRIHASGKIDYVETLIAQIRRECFTLKYDLWLLLVAVSFSFSVCRQYLCICDGF